MLAYDRIIYVEEEQSSSQDVRDETTTEEKERDETKGDEEEKDTSDSAEVNKEKTEDRELNNIGVESEQRVPEQRSAESETDSFEEIAVGDNSLVVINGDGLRVIVVGEETFVDERGVIGVGPVPSAVITDSVSGEPSVIVELSDIGLGDMKIDGELREVGAVMLGEAGESTVQATV